MKTEGVCRWCVVVVVVVVVRRVGGAEENGVGGALVEKWMGGTVGSLCLL